MEKDLGAHRRDRSTSHAGGMGEGPRDDAACAHGHNFSVAVAGERTCGRVGEERLCSSSKCRASRVTLQCKGLFLGTVGEVPVPGSASRTREIQRLERRGAQSAAAAAHAAREDGSLPARAGKEESHTRKVFAHAHAGEDGQVLVLLEVRILHRTAGERACGTVSRRRARPRGGVLRKRKEDGRWLAEPTWHAVGQGGRSPLPEAGWDWSDVVDELERDGLGVDQPQVRHGSHVVRMRNFVRPFGR